MVSKVDLQTRARRNALLAMRELRSRRLEHEAVARAFEAHAARAAVSREPPDRKRFG